MGAKQETANYAFLLALAGTLALGIRLFADPGGVEPSPPPPDKIDHCFNDAVCIYETGPQGSGYLSITPGQDTNTHAICRTYDQELGMAPDWCEFVFLRHGVATSNGTFKYVDAQGNEVYTTPHALIEATNEVVGKPDYITVAAIVTPLIILGLFKIKGKSNS